MSKEPQARLKINKLLEESEWVLVDTDTQKSNVRVETKIESEKQIIEGNKKLIEIYTQKIQDRINKIWGE